MTISVKGSTSFGKLVEDCLNQICTGVKIDGNNVIFTDVTCSDYCKDIPGCNLIKALVAVSTTVTIEFTTGDSYYWPLNPDYTFALSPGTVVWNPDDNGDDNCKNCKGVTSNKKLDACIALAHELIHAWHDQVEGTYELGMSEEICTVCSENQIRQCLGLPMRCEYGSYTCILCDEAKSNQLPNYDCKMLSEQIELAGCECGEQKEDDSCWEAFIKCLIRILAFLGLRTPSQPPPDISDALDRIGFGDLRTGDPAWDEPANLGALVLLRGREHTGDPWLEEQLSAADTGAIIERAFFGGGYRVLLITSRTDAGSGRREALLATNMLLGNEDGFPSFGGPTDLDSFALDATAISRIEETLSGNTFGPSAMGISGQRGIQDGSVRFMRVKTGGDYIRTAVRGYTFPADPDARTGRPDDPREAAHWDAMKTVLNLGEYVLAQVIDDPTRRTRIKDRPR